MPAYVHYRHNVRGHRTLKGQPASTRLAEQHRMALPWILDTLERYARYEIGPKTVTAAGTLHLFYREIALDERLHDQQVTCDETFDGLEVRSADQQVYLWREYVTWKRRYWWGKGRAIPMD